ncbi:hypothetical protein J2T13_002170 [Paenibacillus sp. DS2015]|uniref:hypothetical protein n=1 Tax=Paenibacillus sp. DS2015 TaxID=3373917 RepID=UPI003D21812B
MVQDVLYKIYDANDGTFGFFKSDITPPIHSATFNGLGYNQVDYFSNGLFKQGNVNSISQKLTNYYYKNDLVGEGAGSSWAFKRLGTDVGPWTAKDEKGNVIMPEDNTSLDLTKVHAIGLFYYEPGLKYPTLSNYY